MPKCDFLHCTYQGLCVVRNLDGFKNLCPTHDKVTQNNGWTIAWEPSGLKVFSPVMLRGDPKKA